MNDLPPWSGRRVVIDRRPPLVRFLAAQVPLYALLDTARDPAIHPLLQASGCRHACLFTGERAARLAAHAPWLVELKPGAPLLDCVTAIKPNCASAMTIRGSPPNSPGPTAVAPGSTKVDPASEAIRWQARVKQMLVDRGVAFPAATPAEVRATAGRNER